MTPADYKKLHALTVAAIGRDWLEVDFITYNEVTFSGLVEFSPIGTPYLTEAGQRLLEGAIAGMKGAE